MEWNKDKIKSLRKRFSLAQQQFADKLGVSKRAVRYWEKGKRAPNHSTDENKKVVEALTILYQIPAKKSST